MPCVVGGRVASPVGADVRDVAHRRAVFGRDCRHPRERLANPMLSPAIGLHPLRPGKRDRLRVGGAGETDGPSLPHAVMPSDGPAKRAYRDIGSRMRIPRAILSPAPFARRHRHPPAACAPPASKLHWDQPETGASPASPAFAPLADPQAACTAVGDLGALRKCHRRADHAAPP